MIVANYEKGDIMIKRNKYKIISYIELLIIIFFFDAILVDVVKKDDEVTLNRGLYKMYFETGQDTGVYENQGFRNEFPTYGYALNRQKSTCTFNGTVGQNPDFSIKFKGGKDLCLLYFDVVTGVELIKSFMADYDASSVATVTLEPPSSGLCENTMAYDGTVDNNIRYVGESPCNYVSFNGETWKIIGVMNNIDDGNGNKEARLKIMRSGSIGDYSWDTYPATDILNGGVGINDWTDADLMKLLNSGYDNLEVNNSLYWNSSSGSCYNAANNASTSCDFTSTGLKESAKPYIDSVNWDLGSNNGSTSNTPNDMYNFERGTDVYSGHATDWVGKVALMYISDYMLSTNGGSTYNREQCLAANASPNGSGELWTNALSDCYSGTWMWTGSTFQATLSTSKALKSAVIPVGVFGAINLYYYASNPKMIRPTVYLKPEVKIVGGLGTPNSPYILSLD